MTVGKMGHWFWERYNVHASYILRIIEARDTQPHNTQPHALVLEMRRNSHPGRIIEQKILLTSTKPTYGGVRWWFQCPCFRRSTQLHLPNGAYLFACRICHNLSYESAQKSRGKSQRFFKGIADLMECSTRDARLWFRLEYGGVVNPPMLIE